MLSRTALFPKLLLSLLASCAADPSATLLVELRTDFLPYEEFDTVETQLSDGVVRRAAVVPFGDYIEGERVGEFDASPGTYEVTVRLLRNTQPLITRRVQVAVTANTALRLVISRSCRSRTCPGPDEGAGLTECFESRCVDPRCSATAREFCGDNLCATDAACPLARVGCAAPLCVNGACLYAEVPGVCQPGEWCNPDVGCEPRTVVPPVPDGGVDAGVDVGPACAPRDCADGVECTVESCNGGECSSTPENARCTAAPDGRCDAVTGCQYPVCTAANCTPDHSCQSATCAGDTCQRAPIGSCRDGESEDEVRGCGLCGTETRSRTCASCEFGAWGSFGACTGEGVCAPAANRSESRACGSCGTQSRTSTCTSGCAWGPYGGYGSCSGEGECTAGATEDRMVACGNCGTQPQRRVCSPSCGWGGWANVGSCTGEGVCARGAVDTENQACGLCDGGTESRSRTCNSSCIWGTFGPFGACVGDVTCFNEICGGQVCPGAIGYGLSGGCERRCTCDESGDFRDCFGGCYACM